MGSDLFRARVRDVGEAAGPSDAKFARFERDFVECLALMGSEVTAKEMTFGDFLPLAVAAARRRGLDEATTLAKRAFYYDPELLPQIEQGVSTLPIELLRRLDFWLLGHRVLTEAFPDDVRRVRARRVRVEAVQIHPDAPIHLDNSAWPLSIEAFCMRVLSEATSTRPPDQERSKLFKHFEQHGAGTWYDLGHVAMDDLLGIIWSADVVRTRALPAGKKKKAGTEWWERDAEARRGMTFVEYEVVLHPEWLTPLTKDVFDSRAY